MPLVYERAFGGSDHTHEKLKKQGTEMRNPVGTGFRKNSDAVAGVPLSNVEYPGHLVGSWSDAPPPAGFGVLGAGVAAAHRARRHLRCSVARRAVPVLARGLRYPVLSVCPRRPTDALPEGRRARAVHPHDA